MLYRDDLSNSFTPNQDFDYSIKLNEYRQSSRRPHFQLYPAELLVTWKCLLILQIIKKTTLNHFPFETQYL